MVAMLGTRIPVLMMMMMMMMMMIIIIIIIIIEILLIIGQLRRTRPQAIPLAMIPREKSSWQVSMSMGLRLVALLAVEAPLWRIVVLLL